MNLQVISISVGRAAACHDVSGAVWTHPAATGRALRRSRSVASALLRIRSCHAALSKMDGKLDGWIFGLVLISFGSLVDISKQIPLLTMLILPLGWGEIQPSEFRQPLAIREGIPGRWQRELKGPKCEPSEFVKFCPKGPKVQ